MTAGLRAFVRARLDEDEQLVRADEGRDLDDGVPWRTRPATLPGHLLLLLRAKRDLLHAHRHAAPGTAAEAALHRRLADVAGLYDTHPAFDPRWERPGS